jgi:hypothetical protein
MHLFLTNKTVHTIGQSWLQLVWVNDPLSTKQFISVSPNPMNTAATFGIKGIEIQSKGLLSERRGHFELFDPIGRRVRVLSFDGNQFELERAGLSAGIYLFRISINGQFIGTGKVAIQ